MAPAGERRPPNRRRLEMIAAVDDALREVDVLLCASAMDPPNRLDDAEETERTYPRQARTPFNVTGHPALAMMAGLSSNGLPLSVQFVGRNFAEATLFQVARAWEHAAGTDTRHQPIGRQRASPAIPGGNMDCCSHTHAGMHGHFTERYRKLCLKPVIAQ